VLEDPRDWPSGHNYFFQSTTSNGLLRHHLEHLHKDEYLKLCSQKGWPMQLPNLKLEQASHEAMESLAQCRMAFSADAVTDHLVRFIAAND
jgi:hypothetical protein